MAEYWLLSRPQCGLCEEFLSELIEARADVAAQTAVVNVDERPEWRQRFGLRIPVLIDRHGAVLGEGRFDAARLAAALQP